jgi:hypothetical protein
MPDIHLQLHRTLVYLYRATARRKEAPFLFHQRVMYVLAMLLHTRPPCLDACYADQGYEVTS